MQDTKNKQTKQQESSSTSCDASAQVAARLAELCDIKEEGGPKGIWAGIEIAGMAAFQNGEYRKAMSPGGPVDTLRDAGTKVELV